jgi:hypothetical protein
VPSSSLDWIWKLSSEFSSPLHYFQVPNCCRTARAGIIASKNSKAADGAYQKTRLAERRTSLQRKLLRYRELQVHFMPGLAAHQQSETPSTCLPEDVPLLLPSSFNASNRPLICPDDLSDIERQLRFAQAHDSIEAIRYHLRLRSHTNGFKIKNVSGQGASTQAREILDTISDKVRVSAGKYRRARAAYLALEGRGEWEQTYRVLEEKDLRGLHEKSITSREAEERRFVTEAARAEDLEDPGLYESTEGPDNSEAVRLGEGYRALSWIWYSVGAHIDLDQADMHQGKSTKTLFKDAYR